MLYCRGSGRDDGSVTVHDVLELCENSCQLRKHIADIHLSFIISTFPLERLDDGADNWDPPFGQHTLEKMHNMAERGLHMCGKDLFFPIELLLFRGRRAEFAAPSHSVGEPCRVYIFICKCT